MKNIKFSILLITAIGLAAASLGWLGTWGYKKYFSSHDDYSGDLIVLKPVDSTQEKVAAPIQKTKASDTKNIVQTTAQKDNNIDKPNPEPAAIPSNVTFSNATTIEITKLKGEIERLSKEKNSNTDDKSSSRKMAELQQKIDKLVDKNTSIETENKRLFAVLKQLSDDKKQAEQKSKAWPVVYENKKSEIKTNVISNHPKPVSVNKTINEQPAQVPAKTDITTPARSNSSGESLFGVETMQLAAFTVTDNKEIETSQAYQTDKFVGSIMVKNGNFQSNSGEVIIVILQPDGKVLQKSTWESGAFQSSEGKKIYSCKMRFDYTKGETKKLSFFINAVNFLKGNYTMQVYCKGILIGKMIKTLS